MKSKAPHPAILTKPISLEKSMPKTIAAKNPTAYGIAVSHRGLSLFALLRPYTLKMILGALVLLLTNLIMVMLPSLVNLGVNLIGGEEPQVLNLWFMHWSFNHVQAVIALLIGLAISGAIIRTLSRILIFDVGRIVERDLRAHLLTHVSVLDDDFFAKHQVGEIMSHLTNDIANVRMMTGFAVLNILNIIIIFLFSIPLLLKIDSALALCALLPFPLVIIATRGLTKRMFEATKYYQERLGKMVNHVQENLGGAHVVRLFHQQEAEGLRFSKTNRNTFDAGIKLARLRVLMFPTMRLVIGFALTLILWVGGQAVLAGRITVGDFVEINARIMQLTWPAMSIGFVISIMSRGGASLARLNRLLNSIPRVMDGADQIQRIESIDVVGLDLKGSKQGALDFSLKAGQMLGLVGQSGSYKSTLLKSLYRRIPVAPGTIFFNHHDIVNIELRSLYEGIGVVNQEPFLFHKSIKDNIVLLKPEASLEEIEQVIALVKLDKDIKNFSDGIETIIGERGITLSGGQRQRVALARAMLAKRSLLILDDALSAVDADTEKHIILGIKASLKNSIVIIASHRLSAIKDADQIIVLEKGQVSARGQHEHLMKESPLYVELWGGSHE